jgi:glycosyl-4,4'-diaponeurosporenoate acyltransferase
MLYMLIYALLINLPCIIAQRYNRPRVAKVLAKIKERDNRRKQYSEGTEQ